MGGMRAAPILIAAGLLLAAACSDAGGTTGGVGEARIRFTTEGATTVETGRIEVADTDEERARGLMERTELGEDDGMLFRFDELSTGSFWMKDTLIPLSIAFWGEDGTIHSIVEMTPCESDPCPTYAASAPYTSALEMNAGWFEEHGVEVGDRADVELAG